MRSTTWFERGPVAIFADIAGWRRAGADGRGNAIAQNEPDGGKIDPAAAGRARAATEFDGRQCPEREGRMVCCGGEHWRAARRQASDAAARNAWRTRDCEPEGGGPATGTVRCG